MLFEQDDKLCKQEIKSFEQHIKSSEQVKKIKLACSFPVLYLYDLASADKEFDCQCFYHT